MSYTVIVPKPVQKQLHDLPNIVRNRVIERIALLADDPLPPGAIK
jgi:mRNA interferase RelE/StbE